MLRISRRHDSENSVTAAIVTNNGEHHHDGHHHDGHHQGAGHEDAGHNGSYRPVQMYSAVTNPSPPDYAESQRDTTQVTHITIKWHSLIIKSPVFLRNRIESIEYMRHTFQHMLFVLRPTFPLEGFSKQKIQIDISHSIKVLNSSSGNWRRRACLRPSPPRSFQTFSIAVAIACGNCSLINYRYQFLPTF